MPEKKTYRMGEDVVEIPVSNADAFLSDYPDAVEVSKYSVGEDQYYIPVSNEQAFVQDYPDAEKVGGVKKKNLFLRALESLYRKVF